MTFESLWVKNNLEWLQFLLGVRTKCFFSSFKPIYTKKQLWSNNIFLFIANFLLFETFLITSLVGADHRKLVFYGADPKSSQSHQHHHLMSQFKWYSNQKRKTGICIQIIFSFLFELVKVHYLIYSHFTCFFSSWWALIDYCHVMSLHVSLFLLPKKPRRRHKSDNKIEMWLHDTR